MDLYGAKVSEEKQGEL